MANNFADIIEYSANRFPDNVAVVDDSKSVTYEELNYSVYSVANGFLDMGLGSGDRVMSLLPNCIESVIANFATAKLWCTFVPLDSDIDSAEFQAVFKQIKPKLLIVDAATGALAAALGESALKKTRVIYVGDDRVPDGGVSFSGLIERYSRLDVPEPEGKKDKLCSIIFTSGTSGDRKGVMRTHENNIWSVISITIHRQYKPGDLELFILPLHSVAFYNVFCPNLLCGSTVYIKNGFDHDETVSFIESRRISRVYLLPYMWSRVISDGNFPKRDFSNLKQIMVGATPLSIEAKLNLMQAFPDAELYESWGMTEGGQLALEPSENLRKLGSIGKPLCFNEIKVVDEHGYRVPAGVVGEIILRGKSVTKGYYKDPEGTAKSFPEGGGWFYTGDLARYDAEGYIYLTGRKSEIILYGENRIHPQEVEEALILHPEISEAAVFGYPDEEYGEVVAAAVATTQDSALSEKDIGEYLDKYLADYKKPRHVIFVSGIPKTHLGKTNRRKLIESISGSSAN